MISKKEIFNAELKSQMFKALSNPIRIVFLEKLRDKPWCVCELAKEVGIPKSAASKHLSQLKDAGLLDMKKNGIKVEYNLIAPEVFDSLSFAQNTVLSSRKKMLGQ